MTVSNPSANDIYTITRLNREVRNVLEEIFPTLWVQGEISNLAKPASGHLYFTLKDSAAQIKCALFKNRQSGLRFDPENGLQVLARANIGLYEGRGEYQLIIESLEPIGAGALQFAFEALKQRLSKEGLFDEAHKQTIPLYPKTIGIISSATGAAIRDILSVLKRRYLVGNIVVYPVPVQGEGSASKIARMIDVADRRQECDVLILARGGGSLEDLWSFNEEVVARAIFACKIPIVCGVGHEIDFSIADFVADQRAPTPSAAAELVSPDLNELTARIKQYFEYLSRNQQQRLNQYRQKIHHLSHRIPHPQQRLQQHAQSIDACSLRLGHQVEGCLSNNRMLLMKLKAQLVRQNPLEKLKQDRQHLNNLCTQLRKTIQSSLNKTRQQLQTLNQVLNTISPMATLERGYAIVTETRTGRLVKETEGINVGDQLTVRLSSSEIESTIDKIS